MGERLEAVHKVVDEAEKVVDCENALETARYRLRWAIHELRKGVAKVGEQRDG